MKKIALLVLGALVVATSAVAQQLPNLPKKLHTEGWKAGHVQGIAVDTKALHILVGRDLGVDMMTLENQRQRHSQHKEADCAHRYQNYRYYTTHI